MALEYGLHSKKELVEENTDVVAETSSGNVEKLEDLYRLARRAKDGNDLEEAQKYYRMIAEEKPDDWEAEFFSVYYRAMNYENEGISNAANRLNNCEERVLNLIKDRVENVEDRKKAIDSVQGDLLFGSYILFASAKEYYNGISAQLRGNYTQEYLNNGCAARDVLYKFGDRVIKIFGEEYQRVAVGSWITAVEIHKEMMEFFTNKEYNKSLILSYVSKIQKYDSTYETPEISTKGCYIATAVYGSYDCPEVWTLRRYRDNVLAATWYGRMFMHLYYAVSPKLVRCFGETEWFKKMWKNKLDRMVEKMQKSGVESTPYNDRNWF